MGRLTSARPAKPTNGNGEESLPMAAGQKIYPGEMVAVSGGYAIAVTLATGLTIRGVAKARGVGQNRDDAYDNTDGSDGDASVIIEKSITPNGERFYSFDNATSTDALTAADAYADCYAKDSHTLTRTSTGASVAGEFVGFDSAGKPRLRFKS